MKREQLKLENRALRVADCSLKKDRPGGRCLNALGIGHAKEGDSPVMVAEPHCMVRFRQSRVVWECSPKWVVYSI